MPPHCELLIKVGQIELWKSWQDLNGRPLFVVKSPDGIYCYPPVCDLDNERQAVERVMILGEKYQIRREQVESSLLEA